MGMTLVRTLTGGLASSFPEMKNGRMVFRSCGCEVTVLGWVGRCGVSNRPDAHLADKLTREADEERGCVLIMFVFQQMDCLVAFWAA